MLNRPVVHIYQNLLLTLLLCWSISSHSENTELTYPIHYVVELQPEQQRAFVEIQVEPKQLLNRIEFDITPGIISQVRANGQLNIKQGRATWDLPNGKAKLSFYTEINHERDPGEYDAVINSNWAIFRGDNIIPPMYAQYTDGAKADATLTFKLPKDWSVETGWPRKTGNSFRINNPERAVDRPTGWMIAGKLATRRNTIGHTDITVSAPKGSDLRRMDALTFLGFIWPQLEQAFGQSPDKLLIVGQGDPMWRGGLSSPNSLFLHADRSLVTEDGTSPLIHELVHMVTRISAIKTKTGSDDWIVEGLAEFYSIELIYRANGMPAARRSNIIRRLNTRGKNVSNLRARRSHGDITARAVVLLDQLDKEIRSRSKNTYSIDDVTRELINIRKVSLQDLRSATESLIGKNIKTLNTPLLPAI
ncbi:MAG: hypothetical protein WCY88_14360 [Spongiibacteraceae bacterium]